MSPLFYIVLFIGLGLILLLAELVLLPGTTIATIGAISCLSIAVVRCFNSYGIGYGFLCLGIVLVLVIVMTLLFFRTKTWRKVSLNTELEGTVATPIKELCAIGSAGRTITRLSPMGKVDISGTLFEAKSRTGYIDEDSEVRVIGYDNQNIIVEKINL